MATITQAPARTANPRRRRQAEGSPLIGPLLLFCAAALIAATYVAYVLWPRWPEVPVTLDAPALPIIVAGTSFNIEPAAIRMSVQRRPGTQDRVDLAYLWPGLTPPDPARQPTVGAPADLNERLFVTIASGATTLPLIERVQTIYPRYLAPQLAAGPDGLTLRDFRDGTPYQGEELVFETAVPEHFLARCSRRGVVNSGTCLLERRVGNADITLRFPRDWLRDWKSIASGIDRLLARLHPG